MVKEIRMDYSEYENIIETIKRQQEIIESLKRESRVILVDDRFNYYRSSVLGVRVPKVITDENLAKEYLQKEFDILSEELTEARERSNFIYKQERTYQK